MKQIGLKLYAYAELTASKVPKAFKMYGIKTPN